jgi:hypothetical protein
MSPNVKQELARLQSPDPLARAYGAYCLGEMGPAAAPAVPALIDLLGDRQPLDYQISRAKGPPKENLPELKGNSPGKIATQALVNIGFGAVPQLIAALNQINYKLCPQVAWQFDCLKNYNRLPGPPLSLPGIKTEDLMVREALVKVLRAITGQDFGADAAKWQDWWRKNKAKATKPEAPLPRG